MRLPVLYNSNFQIQDQGGVIIADLFRNPNADEDGRRIVELLNAKIDLDGQVINIPSAALTNGHKPLTRSERMTAMWAAKRAKAIAKK